MSICRQLLQKAEPIYGARDGRDGKAPTGYQGRSGFHFARLGASTQVRPRQYSLLFDASPARQGRVLRRIKELGQEAV